MKRLMITLVLFILAVFLLSACTDVKTVESGQKPTLPSLDAPSDEKEESANITEQAVPIVDSHSVDETSAIVDSESTQFNQTPETTQSSQTVETMPSERETPEATSDTLNDSSEDMTMPTQPQSTQPTSSESNNNFEDDEDEEVLDDVEVTAGEIHFG